MNNNIRLSIVTFCTLLLTFFQAHATTYTFTALTGDWHISGNWENNTLPPEPITSSDTVLIPLGHLVTIPIGYTITNNGLISITETDGITSEGKMAVHGILNNNGRILTGRMEVNGLYNHNAGATIEQGGTVYVRPGGVFNVVGTLISIFSLGNLGTLNVLPSGVLDVRGTFNNIGILVNNGTFMGYISMWDNQISTIKGSGTFTTNFMGVASTASTIELGNSAGCLTFSNNFNNSGASHKLKFEINGPNACTDFDKLIVGGTATIGGTLEVTFGFNPSPAQSFQIIQAAAISGSFSTVTILPSSITATYSAGVVTIESVLATELTHFAAQIKEKTVQLDWQTASEYQNKGFNIERSADGKTWASISFVSGKGSSNAAYAYVFNDEKPNFGKNYYRLRQVDVDGKTTFSAIKTVELLDFSPKITIYPNPALSDITINLPIEEQAQKVQFEVFDTLGRCVMTRIIDFRDSTASVKLEGLNKGLYQIRLTRGRQVWVSRLVIEK